MADYPTVVTALTHSSNQDGSGGGLSHSAYDLAHLAETQAIQTELGAGGVKGAHANLRDRLSAENGRFETTTLYAPAGNSLTPTHNLNTRFVMVLMQSVSSGVTVFPRYESTTVNGISITAGDVPFSTGESIRTLIRAL